MYQGRDMLDLARNLSQFTIFQQTSVAKMDLRTNGNYWENRSIYHRLGPFGALNEFEYKKCPCCDFKYPELKNYSLFI